MVGGSGARYAGPPPLSNQLNSTRRGVPAVRTPWFSSKLYLSPQRELAKLYNMSEAETVDVSVTRLASISAARLDNKSLAPAFHSKTL